MPEALLAKPTTRPSVRAPTGANSAASEGAFGAAAGLPLFLQRREISPGAFPLIQTRLVLNQPGDPFEQEADAVAQRASGEVRLLREPTTFARPSNIQRKCAACAGSKPCTECAEDESVQRKTNGDEVSEKTDSAALEPPGNGSPLSENVRSRIEPALGADLSSVRVHTNPTAQKTAEQLAAKAFTNGNNIWVGPNQSEEDVDLMAHEATHVVQQRRGKVSPSMLQRQVLDAPVINDGEEVRQRLQQRSNEALRERRGQPSQELSIESAPAATSDATVESNHPTQAAQTELAASIDRGELSRVKESLLPEARPNVDRTAETLPQVQAAEQAVEQHSEEGPEGAAEGATEETPEGRQPAAAGGDAMQSAQQAAAMAEQAFTAASSETAPSEPPAAMPPQPVQPLDAAGQQIEADPEADSLASDLVLGTQELRSSAQQLRQHATEQRSNSHILRGNIAVIERSVAASDGSLDRASEHLTYRRGVVDQAQTALQTAEQNAARVSAESPDAVGRTAAQQERSSAMASESGDLVAQNNANTPDDDPEAAANAREQGGKLTQVGSDAASIDETVTQMNSSATNLVQEGAQAAQVNTQTRGRLAEVGATLDQSDERIGQMREQNAAARNGAAEFAEGPQNMEAQSGQLDQRAQGLIESAVSAEERVHQIQATYAEALRAAPPIPAPDESAEEIPIQRQAEAANATAPEQPRPIDIAGGMPSWLTGVAEPTAEDRARAQQEAEDTRRRELLAIEAELGGRQFSELRAGERQVLALRLTGRRLFGGLSNISWPTLGGIGRGIGHLAAGLIDPRAPLMGVVGGINMIANGVAEWHRQPLSIESTWRLAANVATGLTIILGSITALAGLIAGLMFALSIVTLGAAAPITGPVIAFCATVMTTVGTWTFWVGLLAAELQAFMFLIDLQKVSAARDANELLQGVDHMTTDASNAGNALLQAGMGRMAAAGGRQIQNAIGEAGAVQFAARLGTRGPLGPVAQAGGYRAYARQMLAGARAAGPGAVLWGGARAVARGFGGAARGIGGAVRQMGRDLVEGGAGGLSLREGMSRSFLVGSESSVPRGPLRNYWSRARSVATAEREAVVELGQARARAHLAAQEPGALERTRAKTGAELTPDEALTERAAAENAGAEPGRPVELPNEHTIEPLPDGGFCRWSVRICYDANGRVRRPLQTLRDIIRETGSADVEGDLQRFLAAHGGDPERALVRVADFAEQRRLDLDAAEPGPPTQQTRPGDRVQEPLGPATPRGDKLEQLSQVEQLRPDVNLPPEHLNIHPPPVVDPNYAAWQDYCAYYDRRLAEMRAAGLDGPFPNPPRTWDSWSRTQGPTFREARAFQERVTERLRGPGFDYEVADEVWITNPNNPNPRVGANHPDWRPDQVAVSQEGRLTAVSNKRRDFNSIAGLTGLVDDTVRGDVRELISKYSGPVEIHRPPGAGPGQLPPRISAAAPGGQANIQHVTLAYDSSLVPVGLQQRIRDQAAAAARAHPNIAVVVVFF